MPRTEERLCAIAERLERAAGALDRVLESESRSGRHRRSAGAGSRPPHQEQPADRHRVASPPSRPGRRRGGAGCAAKRGCPRRGGGSGACDPVRRGRRLRHRPGPRPETASRRLCTALGTRWASMASGASIHVEVDELAVTPSTAALLGLAVAELVTNALRHAFLLGPEGDRAGDPARESATAATSSASPTTAAACRPASIRASGSRAWGCAWPAGLPTSCGRA